MKARYAAGMVPYWLGRKQSALHIQHRLTTKLLRQFDADMGTIQRWMIQHSSRLPPDDQG